MAVENRDQDEINKSAQDLRKSLRDILESQGDYRDLIKSAIRELKSLDKSYEKIEARLFSLNKGSINVKEVTQELYKIKQKEYIEGRKLAELQNEYGEDAKKTLDRIKQKVQAEGKFYAEANENLEEHEKVKYDAHKEMLHYLEQEGQLEAVRIYAQEKQLESSKERTQLAKKELETEQLVGKQYGLSGNLVESLAKKLGLGVQVQQAMVDHSRNLVKENGKVTSGFGVANTGLKAMGQGLKNSWKSTSLMSKGAFAVGAAFAVVGGAIKIATMAADMLGGAISGVGNIIKNLSPVSSDFFTGMVAPINQMIEKIPIVGGLLSGLVSFWASILDLIIGVEDHIIKSGRQIGMSASQAIKFNSALQGAASSASALYATSKALLDSQVELTKGSELNNIASTSNLITNIELAKFAGIEADTRNKIYLTSLATGTSMKNIVTSVMGQVANLKKTTGIAFNYQAILREVSSLTGRVGLMFTKYPSQLAKSLVTVKALGFELKQLEGIGDTMLDFESSLSKEFEAQLLLGRDINLNKAREAFLNGRLEEAAIEIAKQTGDSNSFLKLNRIQQQSLADLMGMSVDSMSDLLKKQDIYVKTGVKSREELIKQVELSKNNTAEREKLIKAMGREEYQNMINLSTQEKLMASFEKIKQSLVDFLTRGNVLKTIQEYVNNFTDPKNIGGIVEKVKTVMFKVMDFVVKVTDVVLKGIEGLGDMFSFLMSDEQEEKLHSTIMSGRTLLARGAGGILDNLSPESNRSQDMMNQLKKDEKEYQFEKNMPGFWEKALKYSLIPITGVAPVVDMYSEAAQKANKTVNTKDAVRYPDGTIIQPDKLDYSFFTKNPSALLSPPSFQTFAPQASQISPETIKQIVTEVVNGMSNRPVVVHSHANLTLDGQLAARSNHTNMKNNPMIGTFDKTFGQMSLNT